MIKIISLARTRRFDLKKMKNKQPVKAKRVLFPLNHFTYAN